MGKILDWIKCKTGNHEIIVLQSKGVMGSDIVKMVLDERQNDLKTIEFYTGKSVQELIEVFISTYEHSDILFCPEVCIRKGCDCVSESVIEESYKCINDSIDVWIEDIKRESEANGKYELMKSKEEGI